MIYRTDYHIHTIYSDGKNKPEDYIDIAIEKGLSEIGFSDHLTLTEKQQDWSIDPSRLNEYCERIIGLRQDNPNIRIKIGLEVDYFPGKEELISRTIRDLPLDYIIGSVHYLNDQSVDLGPDFYENRDIDRLFESYFAIVEEAALSGLFDIMGHTDLVRIFRYHPAHDPEIMYRKLAQTFRRANVAFELNTNGMNKPLSDFYPDRRYLSLFAAGEVPVCVNSDAHNRLRTAQYFDDAYKLLIASGFNEMAIFTERKRALVPLKED